MAVEFSLRKRIMGILISVNIALLIGIVVLLRNHFVNSGESIHAKLISPGTNAFMLVRENHELYNLVQQENVNYVVFLFFMDSTKKNSEVFAEDFFRCAPELEGKRILVVFMCRAIENCSGVGSSTSPPENPHIVTVDYTDRGNMRKAMGIGSGGTVILSLRDWRVVESYEYWLNPYVLCERLKGLP